MADDISGSVSNDMTGSPWIIKFILLIVFLYSALQLYENIRSIYGYINIFKDVPFLDFISLSFLSFSKLLLGLACLFTIIKRHKAAKILVSVLFLSGIYKVSLLALPAISKLSQVVGNDLDRVYGTILGAIIFIGFEVFLIIYIWFSAKAKVYFSKNA